jgi:CRISPR type I-D-associated protein Csc3/Cas10d
MTTFIVQDIRNEFQSVLPLPQAQLLEAEAIAAFDLAIKSVLGRLNSMPNTENWQLIFDLLHWDWCDDPNRPNIPMGELDKMSLRYSKFGEHQEAVIESQIESAAQWRRDLEDSGLDPETALSLAHKESQMIIHAEAHHTAIANHPSPIAIPQAIVQKYRLFYRAEKRYNPERTNALKPLLLATEIIQRSRSQGEDLVQEVVGRIVARMQQTRSKNAKGRWVAPNQAVERKLIYEFSCFIVYNVLGERFRQDKSAFSSKNGIGLIEDACYALYCLEQDKENTATA